jgi:hypothetical protein
MLCNTNGGGKAPIRGGGEHHERDFIALSQQEYPMSVILISSFFITTDISAGDA